MTPDAEPGPSRTIATVACIVAVAALAGCFESADESPPVENDPLQAADAPGDPKAPPPAHETPPVARPEMLHLTNCTVALFSTSMPGAVAPRDPPPEWGGERRDYSVLQDVVLECHRIGIGSIEIPNALLFLETDNNFIASSNCTEGQPFLIQRAVANSKELANALKTIDLMNVVPGTIEVSRENRELATQLRVRVQERSANPFEAIVSYSHVANRSQSEAMEFLLVSPSGTTKLGGEADAAGSYVDIQSAIVTYSSNHAMAAYSPGPTPVVADVNRNYSASLEIEYFGDHACVIPR